MSEIPGRRKSSTYTHIIGPRDPAELLPELCTQAVADYAIFWAKENDEFLAVHQHDCKPASLDGKRAPETFCSESAKIRLPLTSAVGRVADSGQEDLITDWDAVYPGTLVSFYRGTLAKTYGMKSVACVPYLEGVIEIGSRTDKWTAIPDAAKAVMGKPVQAKGVKDEPDSKVADVSKVLDVHDKLDPLSHAAPRWRDWQLTHWEPEDEVFWRTHGSRIAWKNLMISIPNLCLMFATWTMWSIVATMIQKAHEADETAYVFPGVWPQCRERKCRVWDSAAMIRMHCTERRVRDRASVILILRQCCGSWCLSLLEFVISHVIVVFAWPPVPCNSREESPGAGVN